MHHAHRPSARSTLTLLIALGGAALGQDRPAITSVEPAIAGVGSKVRIRGSHLDSVPGAAVLLAGGEVAWPVEKPTAGEIVFHVPPGAASGPLVVVPAAGDADRLRDPRARAALLRESVVAVSPAPLVIVMPFVRPAGAHRLALTAGGLSLVRDRVIVDLHDFHGFDDAVRLAVGLGGELAGFVGPSNSYVIDLKRPPADTTELTALTDRLKTDAAVADAWPDLALGIKQVVFADPDVVDRYRITNPAVADPYNTATRGPQLHGRMDVWAYDRIQAPAAWNLVARFASAPPAVKVAVLDSGCHQAHREFDANGDGDVNDPGDVQLRKVLVADWNTLRIAGLDTELPLSLAEAPYDLGDTGGYQHGTRVISIIGALNGNDLGGGDRGMNGLLAGGGGPYSIQVHPGGIVSEAGDDYTVTEFLVAINAAAISGARIINASWGQLRPIDPYPIEVDGTPAHPDAGLVRVELRKLARQLIQFQDRLLLCVAAGNEAQDPLSYRSGLVTPFEDFDLDYVLDPGEDVNGNGVLDHGNYVAASLGTLPNVFTVGAIGGPDLSGTGNWARDDKRANFSNYGAHAAGGPDLVVQIAAPGVDVFAAGADGPILIGASRFDRDGVAGTSFATPLVTGTVALLMAVDDRVRGGAPRLTPAQVKQLVLNTTFPADTSDGLAAAVRWSTLKAGAAVRRLLLDREAIADNTAWSGITKIVRGSAGWEVRQDPATRRPVLFAIFRSDIWTQVATPLASLSPDGERIGWRMNASPYRMRETNLESGATVDLVQAPGGNVSAFDVTYARTREPLVSYRIYDLCPNGESWTLMRDTVQYTRIAKPQFQALSNYLDWTFAAPRPDNRKVLLWADLRQIIWNAQCQFASEAYPKITKLLDYPNAGGDVGPPYPDEYPALRRSPRWSGDGRLFSMDTRAGPDRTEIRRDGPGGAILWTRTLVNASSDPSHPGTFSPDGSEVYIGFEEVLKRDGTAPLDLPLSGQVVAWSW